MENASKALIIAGTILLAILLISLGIMVYLQAAQNIDDASLSAEEQLAHNAKFDMYLGNITGANANALVSLVRANNITLDVTGATYEGTSEFPRFDKTAKFLSTAITDSNGKITGIKIVDVP